MTIEYIETDNHTIARCSIAIEGMGENRSQARLRLKLALIGLLNAVIAEELVDNPPTQA